VLAVRGRKILGMVTSPGFLTMKDLYRVRKFFYKFKLENVIKMKNKPYPGLLQTSFLSKEIKKMIPKFRETIPLMSCSLIAFSFHGKYTE
jgi:hypothetical protein